MLRKINNSFASSSEKGSLMIEALAMLGLISMVTPVIYKKAAERTTEMQDVNAASQVRVIVKSVDDYLRDNYNTITNGGSVGGTSYSGLTDNNPVTLAINDVELKKYLPIGFNPSGKTFNGFNLAIHQKTTGSKKTLTAVMVANTANQETFNKLRASRIASMVGTNGGYVDGEKAMGVQGVWEIAKNKLPNTAAPNNSIVATSLQAIADGTAGGNNVLHRVAIPGRPELNTMETALNMGAQNITQVNTLIAQTSGADANTITMEAQGSGNLTLDVDGSTNIAKSLQAAITGSDAKFTVDGTSGNTTVKGTTTGYGNFQIGSGGSNNFNVTASDGSMYASKGNMTVDGSGNTTIKGTTTGWGNFQIGKNGAQNFTVTAADGSMSAATGNMTVDGSGNTLIKGTTTGWGDFQIGSNGSDMFKVTASTGAMSAADGKMTVDAAGETTVRNWEKVWGDFQVGSNEAGTAEAKNFFVTGETGAMMAAKGNMTVDQDGNTEIQGTTIGHNHLAIYNGDDADPTFLVDSDGSIAQTRISIGHGDSSMGETYIRKGVIMLPRNTESTHKNSVGYIKADRLVGNIAATDEQEGIYNNYQINPAYTSMMHDIKLTTRGGARLSDILPDFINKGIYVMDNTYKGSANWETDKIKKKELEDSNGKKYDDPFVLGNLENCTEAKCASSAWLGFIPTPSCPQNYAQVATITPIRFNMAQVGIPMYDTTLKTWNIGQHHDPRLDKIRPSGSSESDYLTQPIVDIEINSGSTNSTNESAPVYSAVMRNLPYNFQINTWLNTTLKAYSSDKDFKGWHGIMGFIYAGKDYQEYIEQVINPTLSEPITVTDDTIIWNLFPVYKEELSAIATTYCYFNRKEFDNDLNLVDHYEAHRQSIDNIRTPHSKDGTSSEYLKRLNDPTITDYKNSKW